MLDWLTGVGAQAPYVVICGILLISGFGLPIPEDVPLLVGGYLCGRGYANPWIMFPAAFAAILGSDAIVFWMGRLYGHHVPRIPLLRRFLTEKRLARTERLLHDHGGKFLFFARFLPGLRTPAIFTAGTFKLPYWKLLLYDGSAAILSVPVFLTLGYVFYERIDQVAEAAKTGQWGVIAALVVGLAIFIGFKVWMSKREAAADAKVLQEVQQHDPAEGPDRLTQPQANDADPRSARE